MTRVRVAGYDSVLIDGNALAHAAYSAGFGSIVRGPDGVKYHTALAYKFLLRVFSIRRGSPGATLHVAWDSRFSRRKDRFQDYKKSRKAGGWVHFEDFSVQRAEFMKVLPIFGVHQVKSDGWEADDVVATLARASCKRGFRTLIVSRDMDLAQLIPELGLDYLYLVDNKVYSRENVDAKLGFPAVHFTTWKALCGDPGDDVPGVPGLGPAMATEIVTKVPNLDAQLGTYPEEEAAALGTRARNLLVTAVGTGEARDYLRLMHFLVSLHTVPLKIRRGELDVDSVVVYLEERRMNSLLERMGEVTDW